MMHLTAGWLGEMLEAYLLFVAAIVVSNT